MSVHIAKRLLTDAEYHKMAEAGILTKDDRVELINGEIITMGPINSLHAGRVNRIATLFHQLLPFNKAVIAVQNPVTFDDHSEPEPDISILHFRNDYYSGSHPTPEEVYLIIEVANSSILYDREVKSLLYAKANIPEYWIINLEKEEIEIFHQPSKNGFLG